MCPGPARGYARHMPQRMTGRDSAEPNRAATPLELLFDLCFVVAVAQASTALHHDLSAGHLAHGVLSFAIVFFAIWWAWVNFSWFASAYDTDDVPYRIATLVQIAGVLAIAAGIPRAFKWHDFAVMVVGYVVVRLGLVGNWLRAAASDPPGRRTALRFAVGVSGCQLGWLSLLVVPESLRIWTWALLALAEMAVPVWAELARPTSWHPGHIAERYGLFTILVLGESILAASIAIQSALDAGAAMEELYLVTAGGLVTVFAMWWLYFAMPAEQFLNTLRAGFTWGYGHYFIFSAVAAAGTGLAVVVDHATHHTELSRTVSGATVTIPVAVFLIATWALQHLPHHRRAPRPGRGGPRRPAIMLEPVAALLVLAATWFPASVLATGVILAVLVAVTMRRTGRFNGWTSTR
jgi:low temperature requirement protein LtrA